MKSLLSVAFVLALGNSAYAHQAPSGWSYDFGCCNTIDCREVGSKIIEENKNGYTIKTTGEFIGHGDKRIKDSPDGKYHWCSAQGKDNTKTICLYRPLPSY